MPTTRKIREVLRSRPTLEGAGVHLNRVFGFNEAPLFDPFLLLDDFRADTPEHYRKGFPWHPHRGIETITYVLAGDVEHGDSLGNKGTISSGDVQWMTAGSGIVHQEMPHGDSKGRMYGFQLWANLPADSKMMNPRYRDVTSAQIPVVTLANKTKIKIVAGEVNGIKGPVGDIVIEPEYLDITVPPYSAFRHPTKKGHTVFAYIIGGQGYFGKAEKTTFAKGEEANQDPAPGKPGVGNGTLVLFGAGDEIAVETNHNEVRFLLIAGKPIAEPIAWRGPIVMNTQEELQVAFEEYQQGTFLKYHG
ncbi:MAG: pirin family protein [Proteobacteria bacterium]|nr:pirin family protein [Pseudomonadota bacterium]MBU1640163.1 pirin family protein [Pseudomonadota bacterium]